MNGFEIATSLFLSFVIGAVIGLEREINEKKSTGNATHATAILGIRSFSLIAVLGAVVGLLTKTDFLPLALLIGSGFFLLLLIFLYP